MTKTNNLEPVKAVIYSDTPPSPEQLERFTTFVFQKYALNIVPEWEKSDKYAGGFCLVVGEDVYDWSAEGRLKQFKNRLKSAAVGGGKIIPIIRKAVDEFSPEVIADEHGTVLEVGDGIALCEGMRHAAYGEIVVFESGVRGMVQDLRSDTVGCVMFGDARSVSAGSVVYRTGKTAGVPVGEGFIGRVVDALGTAIDGGPPVTPAAYAPIEAPAPGIIDRQPVNRPMETGLLVVDSMFPIGRGQRELIIGDRQTGKTALAIDAIINQKGKNVICIYVAIGQKTSSVARLYETLKRRGAADYTIIVCAAAGEPASIQYIAPYSGCAMAEYFMYSGRDVLIVYDDLSKHAVAYRTLSLLLERSPGREAYPGDVFYLHSRLLERAARLSDEKGGGSMTALPIVETQAGDVSAYIPTNIISITDGQLFLESELFFEGQRPAVNVGLSVSRVGGSAQTKALKNASGALRLDLAQYREMEVFSQFSSDLDDTTKKSLAYGQGLMALMRQKQYSPYKQCEEVALLVMALGKVMQDLKPGSVGAFAEGVLKYFYKHIPDVMDSVENTKVLGSDDRKAILAAAKEYLDIFENA